jgi:predicted ATP-grasp superfamily ATP-dependent carboligase
MKRIGYRGHVGIEFKYDERDDEYKLIEVNARFGLWDGMASLCGIDFPYINYQVARQRSVDAPQIYDDGVKWISFVRDLYAFRSYRRENAIGVFEWLRSLSSGKRDYAVFALDDPKPFFLCTAEFFARHLRARKTQG